MTDYWPAFSECGPDDDTENHDGGDGGDGGAGLIGEDTKEGDADGGNGVAVARAAAG